MILQALVKYYEALVREGKVPAQGWCMAKVSFGLNLSEDGELLSVFPLRTSKQSGKKTVRIPAPIKVPQMVSRASGVAANFLCDNSKYLLGIDAGGSGKRLRECFEAAREKHLEILAHTEGKAAEAIRNFFLPWEPEKAQENEVLKEVWEEITDGGNLIFKMGSKNLHEDEKIQEAWQNSRKGQGEKQGICLVTGEKTEISRIHGVVKGVAGAQPSGAALVSFNAQAFESFGKEQSYNAPVGTYAVFAYTTALNYLLSQRDYVFRLGDMTVVFWAESGDEAYQQVFSWSIEPQKDNQEELRSIFNKLSKHKKIEIRALELNPQQKFYILGLAPNAARLSVRMFCQDSFGNILTNLQKHYTRMEIVRPSWEERTALGVWGMLQETVNQKSKDKKPPVNLPGGVLRAILSDARYPENLYTDTLIRIRAEQGRVTWGRSAIIKAFLIKNNRLEEEESFVKVNERSEEVAYILGRIFAVLEKIQDEANPGLNTTIKDRYYNAACTTPRAVFPILIRLKNSHIRKLKDGAEIANEKLMTELMGKIDAFPARLNLAEQGKFALGYYHQVQKRYEKKEDK